MVFVARLLLAVVFELKKIFARSCLASATTCFKVLTSSEVRFKLLARSIEADFIEAAD
jgi:hypothetical protein